MLALILAGLGGDHALCQESPFVAQGEALRTHEEPGRVLLRFRVDVPPEHYLYREMFALHIPDSSPFLLESFDLPESKTKFDPFLEKETEIYDHPVRVEGRLLLKEGESFPETVDAYLSYQGCTSEFCYFPQEEAFALGWEWRDGTEPRAGAAEAAAGGEGDRAKPVEEPEPEKAPVQAGAAGESKIADTIASKGLFLTYIAVFVSGILLSFTPCVFPMIPITLSIIGARGEKNPWKGFLLSLIYVLGMAITYAVLGMVAAKTEVIFGSLMQEPIFIAVICAIFVTLALSMFGLFEIQVPSSVAVRMQSAGSSGGWIGIFLMGIVAGLVASPCVGPVVIGLLTFVAQTGSALIGFTLLFTLAMGIGVLFIAIGTFSGLIASLPGAGGWMEEVRKLFGFLLIGVALYFAGPILPEKLVTAGWGLLLLLGATFFGLFAALPDGAGFFRKIGKAVTLVAGAAGLLLLLSVILFPFLDLPVGTGTTGEVEGIAWVDDHDLGLAEAERSGRPAMINFTADSWCAACREMDHLTYPDPAVIEESRRFVMVHVDCNRITDDVRQLFDRYGVLGIPTVVWFDSSGERREDLTAAGYIPADRFVEIMRQVR